MLSSAGSGASSPPDSYYGFDPNGAAIRRDSDMYKALDTLAKQVGVIGIFSDWAGTVTYYASLHGPVGSPAFNEATPLNLETAVGRARAGRHRVGWLGATTNAGSMPARRSNTASAPEGGSIGCVALLTFGG